MERLRREIIEYVKTRYKSTGKIPSLREILKKFNISSRKFYRCFPGKIEELYVLSGIPCHDVKIKKFTAYDEADLELEKVNLKTELRTILYKLQMNCLRLLNDPRANAILKSSEEIYDKINKAIEEARNLQELEKAKNLLTKYSNTFHKWLRSLIEQQIWQRAVELKKEHGARVLALLIEGKEILSNGKQRPDIRDEDVKTMLKKLTDYALDNNSPPP